MKILHTSDWHLGHQLYGYDRTEEQQSMLNQIERIVLEHKPDVMLVCGDVYHTAQPSAATQRMFAETMVSLHEANPTMMIIVTAGNHDSSTRHEIYRTPWLSLNVQTIGKLNLTKPEEHIIEIQGKGFVIALPYINEYHFPKGFIPHLIRATQERNTMDLPLIVSAHTTIKGADAEGHDHTNELCVGSIEAIELSEFGTGYDYLALGHIHHAQFIHGSNRSARYCGTPLAVSFDENYSHHVSLVEIENHKVETRTLEIVNPHPLVTLPTEGTAEWDECVRLLADFPDDISAYIRLNVLVKDFLPADTYAQAEQITKGKQCKFCHINATRKSPKEVYDKSLSVQEFQAEEPISIVRHYAEDMGLGFDEEMETIFNCVVREVEEDNRNKED